MQSRGVSRARFGILSWLIVVGLSLLAPGNLSPAEQAKLTASDAAVADFFGFSVSIDGDTAVVGAHLNDDAGAYSGSAYVFVLGELTPQEAIQVLVADVIALNLKQGISNSLDAKLEAVVQALDDLNENNDIAAINTLQAVINAVEAQRGVQIPVADADALITAVQEIISLLGG